MSNPFDQFDAAPAPAAKKPAAANPFDKFDGENAVAQHDSGGPADMLGQARRALTKAFAGGLHTASDAVDQTIQKPVADVIAAMMGQHAPLAQALRDPLGAHAIADQSLDVNKQVGADMAASTERAGAMPTLQDLIHNPVASLERGSGAVANRAAGGLPLMAAAVALRNPELAAGLFGVDAGGETYTDLRGEGLDRLHAGGGALGSAAASAAGAEVGIPGIKGNSLLKAIMSAFAQGGVTSLGEAQAHDLATGQETPVADQLKAALGAAGLNALIGTGAHLVHAPFRATEPVAAPAPPIEGRPWPSTPATPAPEAPAPSPERAGPAPSADAGRLLAALTGTTPPVSSVAPVRDFVSNVRTSDWSGPHAPTPEPVKLPDGHPAPEPEPLPPKGKNSDRSSDGLATRVAEKTVNAKTGNPGLAHELIFRPTHDDLRTWIAANGGITPEFAKELGIDTKAAKPLRPGVRKALLIAKEPGEGMDADTARERMQADGWLHEDDPNRQSETDPRNLIFDAIHRGDVIDHPLSTRAEREAATRDAELQARDEGLAHENRTTVPDLYAKGEAADARYHSPEYRDIERPAEAPPLDGRIRILRAKRAAGQLDEAGAHELIDLMDQDARTARLAGGMPLDGVGNMKAESEASAPHKAFVDLDNFKAVNDKIGHAAGDQVIGQTATWLAHAFPDRVFHRGGDEFVIHGASPEELRAGLQKVRAELQSTPMQLTSADGRSVTLNGVGMSYGVGEHVDAAEAGLHADKQARLDAGLRTERRTAGRDSGGHARRAGEHVEDQAAPAAGVVRPDSPADEVKPASEPAPVQGELPADAPQASSPDAPENTTGIKHDKVAEERALKGMDEVEYEGKRTFGDAWESAAQKLKDDPERGAKLARSVLAAPRALNAEESAVLIQDRMRIKNAHEAAMADARHAMETGDEMGEVDARVRMRMAEDALEISDRASKASGYEQGFGLAARRMMSRLDYSMANLITRAKLAAGGEVSAVDRAHLEMLSKRIAQLDKQVADLKADRAMRRSGKTRSASKDAEFKSLSEKLRALADKGKVIEGCEA